MQRVSNADCFGVFEHLLLLITCGPRDAGQWAAAVVTAAGRPILTTPVRQPNRQICIAPVCTHQPLVLSLSHLFISPPTWLPRRQRRLVPTGSAALPPPLVAPHRR